VQNSHLKFFEIAIESNKKVKAADNFAGLITLMAISKPAGSSDSFHEYFQGPNFYFNPPIVDFKDGHSNWATIAD